MPPILIPEAMSPSAAPTLAAIAVAMLIACGSATPTSTEAPGRHPNATGVELTPTSLLLDEAPLPVPPAPPAPPAVTLEALVAVMEVNDPPNVIARLGDLGLTAQCPSEGWAPERSGHRESATCPAGSLRLGDVDATLEVFVTRTIDDPAVARARLVVTADGDRSVWKNAVVAMMLRVRNSFDEISAISGAALPHFVLVSNTVQAYINDNPGEPLQLVLSPIPSRGLLR